MDRPNNLRLRIDLHRLKCLVLSVYSGWKWQPCNHSIGNHSARNYSASEHYVQSTGNSARE